MRHLAAVEHFWFRRVLAVAAQGAPRLYRSADGRNEAFDGAVADPAVVAEAWDTWRGEVAFAEQFVAAQEDLGATVRYEDGLGEQDSVTVREVLVHMIEEYARHMGHATSCASASTGESASKLTQSPRLVKQPGITPLFGGARTANHRSIRPTANNGRSTRQSSMPSFPRPRGTAR